MAIARERARLEWEQVPLQHTSAFYSGLCTQAMQASHRMHGNAIVNLS